MVIKSVNPVREHHERPGPVAESGNRSRNIETSEGQSKTVTAQTVSKKELLGAVDNANEIGQLLKRKLNFSIDDETEKIIVKVVDEESGKVVRQIPAEEMLRISAHLKKLLEMNNQVMCAVKSAILDVTA